MNMKCASQAKRRGRGGRAGDFRMRRLRFLSDVRAAVEPAAKAFRRLFRIVAYRIQSRDPIHAFSLDRLPWAGDAVLPLLDDRLPSSGAIEACWSRSDGIPKETLRARFSSRACRPDGSRSPYYPGMGTGTVERFLSRGIS